MVKKRFESLKKLISSMKETGWIIDSFSFQYKDIEYVVILKLYSENEKKPSEYAVAKLEFIDRNNVNRSILAYTNYSEVTFGSVSEFCDFFHITYQGAGRDLFIDFNKVFSEFIPQEKILDKPNDVIRLQGSRCEGNDPNAIYCYDVRRNGSRGGILNQRSIENSNKAQTLRPNLYTKYKEDTNYSFFFSSDENDERTDEEIITLVAERK